MAFNGLGTTSYCPTVRRTAASGHDGRALSENYLVELQNSVLTNPYDMAVGFRTEQNWLRGPARGAAGVTYVAPPPAMVSELMHGADLQAATRSIRAQSPSRSVRLHRRAGYGQCAAGGAAQQIEKVVPMADVPGSGVRGIDTAAGSPMRCKPNPFSADFITNTALLPPDSFFADHKTSKSSRTIVLTP